MTAGTLPFGVARTGKAEVKLGMASACGSLVRPTRSGSDGAGGERVSVSQWACLGQGVDEPSGVSLGFGPSEAVNLHLQIWDPLEPTFYLVYIWTQLQEARD